MVPHLLCSQKRYSTCPKIHNKVCEGGFTARMKENRKRSVEKKIRFSKEEWSYVENKIAKSPFNNFQNFARILIISGEIKLVDYSNLRQLTGEVKRIGNNINQMAKLAHQFEDIAEEDINSLTNSVEELMRMIDTVLQEEIKKERTI